ncbi:conserved hypothetical protein, partial [Ricinus communis]
HRWQHARDVGRVVPGRPCRRRQRAQFGHQRLSAGRRQRIGHDGPAGDAVAGKRPQRPSRRAGQRVAPLPGHRHAQRHRHGPARRLAAQAGHDARHPGGQ